MRYIYQHKNWPRFVWDNDKLMVVLSQVRNKQGLLMGKLALLGFDFKNDAFFKTLTLDVLKTSEIESEFLDIHQVRSSVARHLGIDAVGLVPSDRNVDGIVEMMLDATQKYAEPLTKERLFDWHGSLFPTGRSGMYPIKVADWRADTTGPMQVISGPMGMEKVHFQAPDSNEIQAEMAVLFDWINADIPIDPVMKAALVHLWFITIHPFDDGNGRIARAITDMLLARSDASPQRFYSMSAQIRVERKQYYDILEKTQKGDLDVTNWLVWFLECLLKSVLEADHTLESVLDKSKFWTLHAQTILNERQRKMVNKLMDDFDGKLTSSKWAKITKCSADTALRDIQDLVQKKILKKELAGGRSTNYEMNIEK